MAREASPLGHPVKIIKISLESKLSIRDFYDFHGMLNSYNVRKIGGEEDGRAEDGRAE